MRGGQPHVPPAQRAGVTEQVGIPWPDNRIGSRMGKYGGPVQTPVLTGTFP